MYEFTLTSSLHTLVHAQMPTETHADSTDSSQSMHQAELHSFLNIGITAQTPQHTCAAVQPCYCLAIEIHPNHTRIIAQHSQVHARPNTCTDTQVRILLWACTCTHTRKFMGLQSHKKYRLILTLFSHVCIHTEGFYVNHTHMSTCAQTCMRMFTHIFTHVSTHTPMSYSTRKPNCPFSQSSPQTSTWQNRP